MRKITIAPGARFGKLVVLHEAERKRYRSWSARMMTCKCDCGNKTTTSLKALRDGRTRSCGCLAKQVTSAVMKTHGLHKHPCYRTWTGMLDRCENRSNASYHNYGGRGICVCEEWHDVAIFAKFWDERHEDGLEIDRIENDGNYEPGNCRFVTRKVNMNNRRNNHTLTLDGNTRTIAEWSEITGLKYDTIRCRCRRGWSDRLAIETPVNANGG